MNNQLRDILDNDETILWQDKPTFLPFLATGIRMLGFGLIWGMIDYSFIRQSLFAGSSNFTTLLFPFFLLHLMPLWLGVGNMIRLFLVFKNTTYALTNKRLILRSGFWGIDFKSIDYDKLLDIQVTINPLENIFHVGSIKINTGLPGTNNRPTYNSIVAIPNPYNVFKQIKTVSVNIKTDWNYPNNLRPPINSGYKTQYKPE